MKNETIKKYIEFTSLIISILALILAGFSFVHSKSVEEQAKDLEIYDRLQEISKNLYLEFRSDSLLFTTIRPCPDETEEEKVSRFTNAAIAIEALESLTDKDEEDMVVFLKIVLLIQQGDYQSVDELLSNSQGDYNLKIKAIQDLRIKYKTCIPLKEDA